MTRHRKKRTRIAAGLAALYLSAAALAVRFAPGGLRDLDYLIVGTLSTALVLLTAFALVVARKL